MNKLDIILSTLPALAAKAAPGHKFTFSMAYHAKDNVFLLSMHKDYNHNDGPMLFLQTEGASTEDAAIALVTKFMDWATNQITRQQEEAMKYSARIQANVFMLETTAAEASLLIT